MTRHIQSLSWHYDRVWLYLLRDFVLLNFDIVCPGNVLWHLGADVFHVAITPFFWLYHLSLNSVRIWHALLYNQAFWFCICF
jgi:hypothetical protein